MSKRKILHTLLHGVSFDLVLCSQLERAQHTARLVLSDRQLHSCRP
ncbi:histidine phosphatase family protein [Escherichia coli]